jgi:integrase/recombinase XerD
MRASFITLAFEGGVDLALVQDGAWHKDPRTTRRYQKRRNNLHKNAVDFVCLE